MKKRPLWLSAALLGCITIAPASAVIVTTAHTLDFNDLGTSTGGVHMPAEYEGFNWLQTDWHYMSLQLEPTNTFLALAGSATTIFHTGGRDIYFDGARIWSRRGLDATGRFYFILHRDGVKVYDGRDDQDGRIDFNHTHQIYVANYTGAVDTVALVFDQNGDDWDHLALDDFQYRTIQAVPDAPVFSEGDPGLPSGVRNAVAWGDYDNDGWKDVFIATAGKQNTTITKLYRNVNGSLVDSGITAFNPIEEGSAAWGDCDNDGDLDLAVIGKNSGGATSTRIYRNNRTNFTAIAGSFVNVYAGALGWADYDGDGDLDLLVSGVTGSTAGSPYFTKLYRNDRTDFVSVAHPFTNVYLGAIAWGDYDSDGDPDLFISGFGAQNGTMSQIYRNDGGAFTNINASIPGMDIGEAAWGDYDNDGDLDLLMTGDTIFGDLSAVYNNNAGIFTDISAGLTGLLWSACSWGDCDNDGDLDIAIAGYEPDAQESMTKIYRNNGGIFADTGASTHGMYLGCLDWVDTDNDNKQELSVAGEVGNNNGSVFKLYENGASFTNTPPGAPTNLIAELDGTRVTVSWEAAADDQTPTAGLSYRVRIGSTPGGCDIVSAEAIATNGYCTVTGLGRSSQSLTARINGLVVGSNYFWSVHAIDAARRGGSFATEVSFVAQSAVPEAVAALPDFMLPVIKFSGSPGGTYLIEASPDCIDWVTITNTTADETGMIGVMADSGSESQFFRAVRP